MSAKIGSRACRYYDALMLESGVTNKTQFIEAFVLAGKTFRYHSQPFKSSKLVIVENAEATA